jgi:4-amino-4-deoxy-L-arabinose transferase-like glycosyltransferase
MIIGALFFIPYLGNVHLFDWDEINFAESAREMIVTGDYLNVRIDYEPFHEKPPLFIWIQAISMHIFGVNEFAARLPNALCGIITFLVIFSIGKKFFGEKFGLIWVLVYLGSILPHFYFKTAIIDPVFNLFMYLGIYYLSELSYKKIYTSTISANKELILGGIFTAAAIMTKGPVGFLLVFTSWAVFWVINRKQFKLPIIEIILFTLIAFLPAVIWYTAIFVNMGGGLISDFILYQIRLLTTGDAGHDGPFYYHFVVLLIGCFPASILILRSFRNQKEDGIRQHFFKIWNFILLAVVLVIFSIVKTKIVHYSSLAFFPITFLAAYTIYYLVFRSMKWKLSSSIFIGVIGLVLSLGFFWFPVVLMNIEMFLPKIIDKFTNAILSAQVQWGGYEYIIGIIYFSGILISLILLTLRKYLRGFIVLFGMSAISLFLFLPMFAPKIELYTQNAPVEFFKSLENQDAYFCTIGYKSYAPYFYSKKPFNLSKYYLKKNGDEFEKWLLTGDIYKSAYFSIKNLNEENIRTNYPQLIELYRKNGFIFYKRKN